MATRKEKELLEQIKQLNEELERERQMRREFDIKEYRSESIILVSNRLPISLKKDPTTNKWTTEMGSGGLVSAMSCLKLNMKWIGWIGMECEKEDMDEINEILQKINCIPIYLPKDLLEGYYNGFSNDVLWPILHYVQLPIDTLKKEKEYWHAYEEVNKRFCSVILENSKENEMIWVQDYHLMVLPMLLRKARSRSRLGWFLHTPFPNSDVFRTLSHRVELLKGVLACDLVGFHIYNYVRNFKNACVEILGCEASADAIEYNGKLTIIDAFPIGIDMQKFLRCKETQKFKEQQNELRERYGEVKIIIGVDRLDYIKGILHKLAALEHFFNTNKNWINKVTYVQIAVPTRKDVHEYQKLAENVHELVGRINGKFSNLTHVPINYLDQSIPIETLVALYSIADVCLITSLRDGMNLVSYEYIVSQDEKVGVLILSEFVGAAQSLGAGSIQINPWNIEEVSDAIRTTLSMSKEEKEKLFNYGKQYIIDHSAQNWAEGFIFTLDQSWKIANLVFEEPTLPSPMDLEKTKEIFLKSKKKLIICGVVGTLMNTEAFNMKSNDDIEYIKLSKSNIDSLRLFCADENVDVIVATSRTKSFADEFFKEIPLIVCAENGFYLKDYSLHSEWIKSSDPANLNWMDPVEKVMQYFVERTPSSFLERQESMINWHYSNCSDPFSEKQARDLINNLQTGPLPCTPTDVVHDKQNKFVKVRLTTFNKKYAIQRALDYLKAKNNPSNSENVLLTSNSHGSEQKDNNMPNLAFDAKKSQESGNKDKVEKRENLQDRPQVNEISESSYSDFEEIRSEENKSGNKDQPKRVEDLQIRQGQQSGEKSQANKNLNQRKSKKEGRCSKTEENVTIDEGNPKRSCKNRDFEAKTEIQQKEVSAEIDEPNFNSLLRSVKEYNFVLCIGSYFDSDQDVFSALNDKLPTSQRAYLTDSQFKHISSAESEFTSVPQKPLQYITTVSVGKRKSLAKEYLKNADEVKQLLHNLSNSSL